MTRAPARRRGRGSAPRRTASLAAALLLSAASFAAAQSLPTSGEELYRIGCAKCHGEDGRGVPSEAVGFDVPLPDFSDCSFATREPDLDWIAVTHDGGPARGFDPTMPAFGEAFTVEQIRKIIDTIRGFCTEPGWPRGELNLPRPFVTEKAYPEDELVWTVAAAAEGPGAVTNEILYERRFGARSQWELAVPFDAARAGAEGAWTGGIGDVAFGVKRALYDRLDGGLIVSVLGEIVLPTGDERRGRGKGTVVLEPALALGKLLPGDAFLHGQVGVELPADTAKAEREAFWRVVFGRTFTQGRWGRTVSPMVELLGATALEGGATDWDLLPQVQVSLNRRQHVLLDAGVRLPLTDAARRPTRLYAYLIWEWFDGGFFEGW